MPRNYQITITSSQGGSGVPTTVALVATPATPQVAGTTETLTATMSPIGATGLIQFYDGGTLLATVTLASGVAAYSTALAAGNHSLYATFLPDTNYLTSTSPTIPYAVTSPATATSTILTVAPNSPASAGATETLTATVSPNTAVGTVSFYDGATPIGAAVTVVSGVASTTTVLTSGSTHTLNATFTPTNSANFTASSAPSVSYTVSPSGSRTIIFGSSIGSTWSVTNNLLHPNIVRVFTASAMNSASPTRAVCYSEKPTNDFGDPSRSSALYITQRNNMRTAFSAVPDTKPGGISHRVAVRHEPENDGTPVGTGITPAVWIQMQVNFVIDVVRYLNLTRVNPLISTGILMSVTGALGDPNGLFFDSWYTTDANGSVTYLDELGYDIYKSSHFAICHDYSVSVGRGGSWCIPEHGENVSTNDSDALVLARMKNDIGIGRGFTTATQPTWWAWFNQNHNDLCVAAGTTNSVGQGPLPLSQAYWLGIDDGTN